MNIDDIKIELEPILDYLKLEYIEDKLMMISLQNNVSVKYLKEVGVIPKNTTYKQITKLFDIFNDNTDLVSFILEEINKERGF
ncbi:MAG: hypothetical protein EOL97_16570 [Spirochaetia bacterium]|nr:hypothetical protein [Spirochaetia bacterium]